MDRELDLTQFAGFDLWLDPVACKFSFGQDAEPIDHAERTLADMRAVLREPATADRDPACVAYRAVRAGAPAWSNARFASYGLRFDLLVIPPARFGHELAKTSGHYHARHAAGYGMPEIYEVLHGRAAFLLQSVENPEVDDPIVTHVTIVECAAGDRIVIPPDCGHVTINPGSEPLAYATLVARASRNLYAPFEGHRGAAYYVVDGDPLRVERNAAYGDVPTLDWVEPERFAVHDVPDGPIPLAFHAAPERFGFLTGGMTP